jgi:hypothetical protein
MSESNQPKGTFVLFKNIKKEGDHPRKPVYSGSIELPDGTKFDLAGWINEGKVGSKIEGQKYIKGEVKEPWVPQQKVESRESRVESQKPTPSESNLAEDDIPF